MEESEVLNAMTSTADVSASVVEAIADAVRDVAVEKGKQHGQGAIAAALKSGEECLMYSFEADRIGRLDGNRQKQLDKFCRGLDVRGVNYARTRSSKGTVIILVQEKDKDLARQAARRVNIDLTREYMEQNSDEARRATRQEREQRAGSGSRRKKGKGREATQ